MHAVQFFQHWNHDFCKFALFCLHSYLIVVPELEYFTVTQNLVTSKPEVPLRILGVLTRTWSVAFRLPSLIVDLVLPHPPITISYPSQFLQGAKRTCASVWPLAPNSRKQPDRNKILVVMTGTGIGTGIGWEMGNGIWDMGRINYAKVKLVPSH